MYNWIFVDYAALIHVGGIPTVNEGIEVLFYLHQDKISINKKQFIPLSRIKGTQVIQECELTEKSRSVIKRAIVGGVLLGGIGAVVGGMSGLDKGKRQQNNHYFSIDYVDKNGNEQYAVFLIAKKVSFLTKVETISKKINDKIGYVPPVTQETYEI